MYERMCDKTTENREMFMNFVLSNDLWVANTHYQKRPDQLCTYCGVGTNAEVYVWGYEKFAQIDYIIWDQRWKNWNANTEADDVAYTLSDHFPIWGTIKGKFAKRKKEKNESRQNRLRQYSDRDGKTV